MTARTVRCPVSDLGPEHRFVQTDGTWALWDVMGDPRRIVQVCPECAKHIETTEQEEEVK